RVCRSLSLCAPTPRRPRSTRFPYTTLFRSRSHHGNHHLTAGQETSWVMTWFPSWLEVPPVGDARPALERTCAEWTDWLGQVRVEDRKSTRLNSSHVSISYAVFCLKKKRDCT